MTSTAASPICFGDVVKLFTKSDDDKSSMGFLEHKNDELLLVMGPVKESVKDKYQEAEFIVAPIRCEKPPASGTPLKYKQSFVLMTSSKFEEYSLNNKMHAEDTIGLQCRDVKGEMYVAFEKEGYTIEANVMDGDVSLDLVVVDSNRMRKNYNKKLALHTKSKALALGGYVTCGSKGKAMSLRIAKVPGATETKPFAQKKIVRRRSTLTKEMLKADEIARANRVSSDGSEAGVATPTGSATAPVAADVATEQESASPAAVAQAPAPDAADVKPVENSDATAVTAAVPAEHSAAESSHEPSSTTASTAESTTSTAEPTVSAVVGAAAMTPTLVVAPAQVPAAPVVELFADLTLKETKEPAAVASREHTDAAAVTASPLVHPSQAEAVALNAAKGAEAPANSKAAHASAASATPSSSPGATPQATERSLPQSPTKLGEQQLSSLTVTSEAEGGEEKVDSTCLGGNQCSIM